ncbi:MAG: hypothetical protein K2Q18_01615, partial [Bdellovibrionales bacterium]|nr:hypothetical protein [Bdellovibrionales bacterium]
PYLKNLVLDTHFSQRNRQGRLMGFMANGFFKKNIVYNGIGVDEGTALCFGMNGVGKFFGNNYVYFLRPTHSPRLSADHSLSWDQLHVRKFSAKDVLDLKKWDNFNGEETWNSENFIIDSIWQ